MSASVAMAHRAWRSLSGRVGVDGIARQLHLTQGQIGEMQEATHRSRIHRGGTRADRERIAHLAGQAL